jgi:uncharacterized caspase-like protein
MVRKVAARYPTAIDPAKVGRYPALTKSGGGYVWDEVLEYRVWCHPERGAPDHHDGDDYFLAFATYPRALAFARRTRGAEAPLVLVRQRQSIDEPTPGVYVHVKKVRITEWRVEWLSQSRRTPGMLRAFFAPDAPANRLELLRGGSLHVAPAPARARRPRARLARPRARA